MTRLWRAQCLPLFEPPGPAADSCTMRRPPAAGRLPLKTCEARFERLQCSNISIVTA
jgi:hypothetical protein